MTRNVWFFFSRFQHFATSLVIDRRVASVTRERCLREKINFRLVWPSSSALIAGKQNSRSCRANFAYHFSVGSTPKIRYPWFRWVRNLSLFVHSILMRLYKIVLREFIEIEQVILFKTLSTEVVNTIQALRLRNAIWTGCPDLTHVVYKTKTK